MYSGVKERREVFIGGERYSEYLSYSVHVLKANQEGSYNQQVTHAVMCFWYRGFPYLRNAILS